jgi:hypothetical protein
MYWPRQTGIFTLFFGAKKRTGKETAHGKIFNGSHFFQ